MMILILTQCFPSRLGGIESLVSNLALELGKSNQVVVFADSHDAVNDAIFDNQSKNKIVIKRTSGIKFLRRRKKFKEVKNFIESNEIKIVLADTWKSLELNIDYLNNKNLPVICLAHGNELLFNNKSKSLRIKKTFDKVSSVVANSIFTKNLVKKIINSQINVTTIYPGGVDLNNLDKSENLGITGDPIILTLARLEKRKGHIEIINTVEKLTTDFPDIKYLIAGIGPELKNLKKAVRKKNLDDNVLFLGNINDYQKKYIFQKTQLMVMPTLDQSHQRSIEGFGIVYIEAAFFSVPSIASNIGGTPEAVINNSTGKIIDNIDELFLTIKNLLLDQNKIMELGQNAKRRASKEFNWDSISKKYLSLINVITKVN